ncbi:MULTISPECIES: replication initiation factor domain-containing protein [Leuconostoc]|uniref:replication initiation factor domain-containing protein n=1 Tax=Leuconostoc TaxID=1243 RepID=UPI00046196A5|nr:MULTISPECIES: replication initiation factor domain-containing protein [Leuconostoc]KDA49699.1 transcriptional regulator, Cro/CI family [Leuconostoc pseudomesenteroides PS12]OQJ70103.1 transcriptional regulator [Leuconostoc pseudomesenteroides]MDG9745020.1 replication initiation factor domain-containing protein [Leuconostoc falkenbergense]ORI72068.1 transcriptional regulator [Leuconostoc pseudomesenteroides]ORI74259.1 transcriptional regulator [Leuconostoc pseudomesenteroides]
MTVLAETNQFYSATFLGTTQHSLAYTNTPLIKVGLSLHGELQAVKTIKVNGNQLSNSLKLGDFIELGTIKGDDLNGYTAISMYTTQADDNYYRKLFTDLERLKNVGKYQLLKVVKNNGKENNEMEDFIKAPKLNGLHIKTIRELLGFNQLTFSKKMGVSNTLLSLIESDNKPITDDFVEKMYTTFPDLKNALDLQFDWVTITFSDMTGEQVINDVMRLKPELFLERSTTQNFYTREFAFAGEKNIYVQDFEPTKDVDTNQDVQKIGATMYLTGQGTRLFEKALLEQGLTWKKFFVQAKRFKGTFSRLDIAINDNWGLLDMEEIIEATQKNRFWSKSRSFAIHGNNQDGWTANFGKSPFVIRIYDKQKEQEQKGLETSIKNRVELELHADRAEQVISEWFENDNLVEYSASILYTYLWFVDEPIDEEELKGTHVRERYIDTLKPMPAWSLLTSLGQSMKFVREPKEQSVDSILSWIMKYVVPSLEVLKKTGHWHEVIEAMDKANLSPEQEKLIKANLVNAITNSKANLEHGNLNFDKQQRKYVEETAEFEKKANLPF